MPVAMLYPHSMFCYDKLILDLSFVSGSWNYYLYFLLLIKFKIFTMSK